MSDQQSSRLLSFNFAAILAFVLSLVGIDAIPDTKRSPEAQVVSAPVAQTNTQADPQNQKRQEFATELPTFPNVRTEIAGRWADPFKGRKKELRPCAAPAICEACRENQFADLQKYINDLIKCQSLTVLPIQLDAGDLPSQQETRINTRHAVEYALATAGYQMDFQDQMSYVSPSWKIWFGGQLRYFHGEVPISLYSRRMKDKPAATTDNAEVTPATNAETENCTEHLLVCWIDNQLLGSKRIETLATLLYHLLPMRPA